MRLHTVAFISGALLAASPAFFRSPVQCRIAGETGAKPCHFEIDVR
jgi:hypothetical protein